jgi:hypothetical protein
VTFNEGKTFKISNKVDWRQKGVVSNPILQLKSGGSWAFAAASAIEISHNIQNDMFIEPSV